MKATRTRVSLMVALGLAALAGGGLLWVQATQSQVRAAISAVKECPASPITTEKPKNTNTAAFSHTWYRSPDGRIWASAPGLQSYRPEGNKVLWVKPGGSELHVEGRRLDGEAGPLEVGMPCCYYGSYQASGVTFPTPGCWEIEAKAADAEWRFVVYLPSKE